MPLELEAQGLNHQTAREGPCGSLLISQEKKKKIKEKILKAIRIFLSKQEIFTSWHITTVLHMWMTIYIYIYIHTHICMHITYNFKNVTLFSCLRVSSYERARQHFIGRFSIFAILSLPMKMFFSLLLYHTIIFAFVVYAFGVIFTKSFQILMSRNFIPMFSDRNFRSYI